MTAAALLVRKEFRAGTALVLAAAVGMLAAVPPLPQRELRELGPLFYVIGSLALGANAVGHEYRYGTLAQLLTQPIGRARLLAVKMAALAAMLLAVAGVGAATVFSRFTWSPADRGALAALFVLPLAYGFVVAPWLTLKTRRTLAGTLFSGSLAALLLLAGNWAGWMLFDGDAEIDAFKMRVLWIGSSLLCVFAAIGLWRSFAALQAADAVRSDIALPRGLPVRRETPSRRPHPLAALAGKELRLQQLAFVAPAFYVVLCLTLWARRSTLPRYEEAIALSTVIHGMVIAALTGAFSCSEERVLGTLEWQLLQPVSARAQFGVKVAVTFAVALLLAVGVPALMSSVLGIPLRSLRAYPMLLSLGVLLCGSVYLSSVSSSAVAAFLACTPAFMVFTWFMQNVVGRLVFATLRALQAAPAGGHVYRPFPRVAAAPAAMIGAALVVLVLECALDNHRTMDRSSRRIAAQVAIVATLVAGICLACAVSGRVLFL